MSTFGGYWPPTGTVASATSAYETYVPSLAIDHDVCTKWEAESYDARLTLTFPEPTEVREIQLVAGATPSSPTTYTFTGTLGDASTTIGVANVTVPVTIAPLTPILVTPGAYDSITVRAQDTSSWIIIAEVSIYPD